MLPPVLTRRCMVAVVPAAVFLTAVALTPATAAPGTRASTTPTAPGAGGGRTGSAAFDPRARRLLDTMHAAYQALHSFSATIHFSNEGKLTAQAETMVALQKPDLVSVTSTGGPLTTRVVSDGSHVYAAHSTDQTLYYKLNVPPPDLLLIGAAEAGKVNLGLLPFLFSKGDPLGPLRQGLKSLTMNPPDVVDGVPVDILSGTVTPGPGIAGKVTLAIGREDHLLRQVTVRVTEPVTRASILTESHTAIRVNPALERSTFVFTPPTDAVALTSLEPPLYDPHLAPGAKPIPFTGSDLHHNPVSLDDYAGKVVLLDFWASWAAVCRKEVPAVTALYRKYHPQGLEILGISLDYGGSEEKDLGRSEVIAYIEKNGITWPQVFDGKAWNGTVPTLYSIQAVPLTILVGRDGRIASVNARGNELEASVRQALGKPGEVRPTGNAR